MYHPLLLLLLPPLPLPPPLWQSPPPLSPTSLPIFADRKPYLCICQNSCSSKFKFLLVNLSNNDYFTFLPSFQLLSAVIMAGKKKKPTLYNHLKKLKIFFCIFFFFFLQTYLYLYRKKKASNDCHL